MAPIRKGDGTPLEIPGVSEVRSGDGRVFFDGDAIPDSEDLHSRFDFSEEDGSVPVVDQTNNGNDLDSGSYSGVGVDINGVQAGDFDGNDDGVAGSGHDEIDTPYHEFAVFVRDTDGGGGGYITSAPGDHPSIRTHDADDEINARPSDNDVTVTANHGDPILVEVLWDTDETTLHNVSEDNTDTISEVGGSSTGLTLGRSDGGDFHLPGKIGEVLRYTESKETKRADIHDYLESKWNLNLP